MTPKEARRTDRFAQLALAAALLAAVVGSVIVAVGGGGIRTMQRYWERAAGRAEARGPELRDQVRASAQADDFGDGRITQTRPIT